VLAFVLYPYVYLLARTAFLEQSAAALESARMLGHGPWRSFFRIALPLARPGIAAGTALCLMETLADYGTVAYFGVNTFSTGIFRAWFSLGDAVAAAQLGALLLAGVAAVLALERFARGRSCVPFVRAQAHGAVRAFRLARRCRVDLRARCRSPQASSCPRRFCCALRSRSATVAIGARFLHLAWNSLTLAGVASLLAVCCALIVAYAVRMRPGIAERVANRVAGSATRFRASSSRSA
jgi:iron(III) transport system permease protein